MSMVVKKFKGVNGGPSWKLVAGVSIGLTATLVSALWGVTWAAIQTDVSSLEERVTVNDIELSKIEIRLEYIKEGVDELKVQMKKLIGLGGG